MEYYKNEEMSYLINDLLHKFYLLLLQPTVKIMIFGHLAYDQALPGKALDRACAPKAHLKRPWRAIHRAPQNLKTILPRSKINF